MVFYVLLDDNAPTVIGQSLLRLIPSIELSRDRMVLRKESQKKDGRATPMRLEKPDLYVQLNSSKGSLVAKLGGGDENIIPHYFSTAENIQIGGMPIDVNACHLDKDLDMVIDMKGVISLPYLLRQADRVVFDFENMTVSCY